MLVTLNPGKFIVGLTGNIGTGKSLVLKMLEQKGAFVIDADAISRRVMMKDAPAFQPVVDAFGKWILAEDGEIDRKKLGRLVFGDPDALRLLESIVHPFVREAIQYLITHHTGPQEVIAIEAIKLLESPTRDLCDAVWVVTLPTDLAIQRLTTKRGMNEQDARQRMEFQGDDGEKLAVADVVINNEGSASDTWKQVSAAYDQIIQKRQEAAALAAESPLRRFRPSELDDLRAFVTKNSRDGGSSPFISTDDRAFLFLKEQHKLAGVAGWFAENFIARLTDLFTDAALDNEGEGRVISGLVEAIEREARWLGCEVLLFFLPLKYSATLTQLAELGFESKDPAALGLRAWTEAAREQDLDGRLLLVKTLNPERVLKPL